MKTVMKISIVAILILTLAGCGSKNKKEDVKVNTNEDVIKDQVVEELNFTNTSLIYENGTSTLVTDVTNNTSEVKLVKTFNVEVKDSDGNIIATLIGYIGDEIKVSETRTITIYTETDLTKADSIEYSMNK